MRLELTDILHQEFKRAFRGYNRHEVSAFLEVVAENYTELNNDNAALLQKIKLVENEMEQLRIQLNENEKMLQSYKLEMAKVERLMDSKIDADFILQKAKSEAEHIITESKKQADRIASETKFLLDQRAKVAAHLREYLKSQMALLGIISDSEEPLRSDSGTDVNIGTISDAMETDSANSKNPPSENAADETPVEIPQADGIDSFLSDVELDDIPQELAHALSRYKDNEVPRVIDPEAQAKMQQMLDDLDSISEHATGMFKKADFHKMLGDDIHTRSEEMINQIYAELEKKKSLQKDNSNPEEKQ
ncbi:DivIVA domain-containing protein [bacterium]|nr:DivIVA domain-containing protein [bacterium]